MARNHFVSGVRDLCRIVPALTVVCTRQFDASKEYTESELKEKVLSNPSPDHLIIALKNLPITLVVEDFHYLKDEVKSVIFQQWKNFIDNEISVIVLGTTHRAVDIANSNKDLLGIVCQIDVSR